VLATGRSQVASANRTSNQGLCYGRGVVDGAEAFLVLWKNFGCDQYQEAMRIALQWQELPNERDDQWCKSGLGYIGALRVVTGCLVAVVLNRILAK